jgi:AAA family ATP:ADP antiporter
MHDPDPSVAREAIRSAQRLGDEDLLFVPALVSLTRDRRLKNEAREALVSYGEDVVPALAYFLRDEDEDPWVRRHIPGTLARIPCPASVAALLDCLDSDDGFLRYKAIVALERLRRDRPDLRIEPPRVEKLCVKESTRYFRYLGLSYNLFEKGSLSRDSLLAQALAEKLGRGFDRIFRLLGLLYDENDMRTARYAIERGDPRTRASAIEFLDNLLSGQIRKLVLPIIDEIPLAERVRKGNVLVKSRVRGVEETVARLIYDDDPVVAATAIDVVREQKLWTLVSDLEEVLQFRDAEDYSVFESASYAIAAFRLKTDEPLAV